MYSNQLCHVKWRDETSAGFSISNGVKQPYENNVYLSKLKVNFSLLKLIFRHKVYFSTEKANFSTKGLL